MTKNKNDSDTKDMIIEELRKTIDELLKKIDKIEKENNKLKEKLKK